MTAEYPRFRKFVLGAGFSQLAGLPLANELFTEVRRRIESRNGPDTKFQRDVIDYMDYCKACDGVDLPITKIDLEEFMSYLDMEHILGLRGRDTWSEEGNESQLMIRKAIGGVINNRTPPVDSLPDAYYRFAERLTAHDLIITFNYDILLERALQHIGKPYRLFPQRFRNIARDENVVDSDFEEVTVLKIHGSMDWFDDRQFLQLKASLPEQGSADLRIHSVFDKPERYGAEPLVQGPRPVDDPLLHIHRIRDADNYYLHGRDFDAPFILSPSHVKFVYAEPLLSFWNRMGRSDADNHGISVIGFSLPKHDEYIRIALYQMISSYQQSWWNDKMFDVLKDYVRLIDCRKSDDSIDEYKHRYSFVDPEKSVYMFDGFGDKAIEFIFDQPRES